MSVWLISVAGILGVLAQMGVYTIGERIGWRKRNDYLGPLGVGWFFLCAVLIFAGSVS